MESEQPINDAMDKLVDELEAFKRASLTLPPDDETVDELVVLPDIESLRALDLTGTCEMSLVASQLREKNLHKFDPVRFRFIESMLEKAAHQPKAAVSRLIEAKAKRALADYIASFMCSYDRAKEMLENMMVRHPECAGELKKHFVDFNFRGMENSIGRIPCHKTRPIAELLQRMSSTADSDSPDHQILDEDWLIESVAEASGASDPLHVGGTPIRQELKAVRAFKASSQKREVDSRVTQAIEESPENAGPLNPQRLMVRSLSTLRELSPAYLGRFVTMIDAMLWLEAAGPAVDSGEHAKPLAKGKAAPLIRGKNRR